MGDQPMETMVEQAGQVAMAPERQAVAAGPKYGYYWGTGRRKTAVARVRIKAGEGKFEVNGKPYDKFFNEVRDRNSRSCPWWSLSRSAGGTCSPTCRAAVSTARRMR